jgi:hypothetical protein
VLASTCIIAFKSQASLALSADSEAGSGLNTLKKISSTPSLVFFLLFLYSNISSSFIFTLSSISKSSSHSFLSSSSMSYRSESAINAALASARRVRAKARFSTSAEERIAQYNYTSVDYSPNNFSSRIQSYYLLHSLLKL